MATGIPKGQTVESLGRLLDISEAQKMRLKKENTMLKETIKVLRDKIKELIADAKE